MSKEADRVKRWRERQKVEGRTSFTVLLSQEARAILTEEKEKTGESYAVIVEKALQSLKSQNGRPPSLKHFPKREDALTRMSLKNQGSPIPSVTSHENEEQPRIIIDDSVNYPSHGETAHPHYNLHSNEGLITRLLRFSEAPFGRRKKWFK
jgi:hypothetical protein